jgi:hypothetical protein
VGVAGAGAWEVRRSRVVEDSGRVAAYPIAHAHDLIWAADDARFPPSDSECALRCQTSAPDMCPLCREIARREIHVPDAGCPGPK